MHSPLASPRATREVLDRFGLSAKHRLGQNFLVDDNVIGRILDLSGLAAGGVHGIEAGGMGAGSAAGETAGSAADGASSAVSFRGRLPSAAADGSAADGTSSAAPGDAGGTAAFTSPAPASNPASEAVEPGSLPCVLEVGPGIGTLTCALLRRAYVVAVECDADLPPVLAETCALDGERLRIVQADALKLDRRQIEQACAEMGAPLPSRLVANLPYQVAATLVLDWFERFDFIESMTVMVQAEVADRMAAAPGTKDYGAYTVKLALRAHVAGRFSVPPTCFTPKPHVDSAVVRLERNCAAEEAVVLLDAACKLADAAFAQRRKTIRNSMKSRLDAATADAALAACGIDPTTRAETLSPGAYLRMASALLSRV